jgi:hypothetical protein
MTQQVIRGRVSIPSTVANIDGVSMDFTYEATGSDVNLDFTAAITPFTVTRDFFNVAGSASNPIGAYLAPSLSRTPNACQINWTDVTTHLDGTPAGGPFRTDTFTLPAALATQDMPGAVCVAIGYRANYGGAIEHGPLASLPTPDDAIDYGAPPTHMGKTRPRARMRSRLFFGPIGLLTSFVGPSGGLLGTGFKSDISATIAQLLTTFNSTIHNQFNLVVWSKRDAAVHTAKNYYVNEAFATQNRRSDPTALRVHNWVNVP